MTFSLPWGSPFYSGGGTSSLVPSRFHVAIAGRPYMLDTQGGPPWVNDDIPVQRAQADTDADPGEGTLSTEGLWRRTRQSWHLGAGQEYCLAPDTRVLTGGLRWVALGEVSEGDELVGFEESPGTRRGREWRPTTVVTTQRIRRPCYQLRLSDGTKIVASAEHQWLNKVSETYGWIATDRIRDEATCPRWSTKMIKLFDVWDEDLSWGAGYLAAAFDGEGWLTQTSNGHRKDRLLLGFAQRDNAMLTLVQEQLEARGFPYSTYGGSQGVRQIYMLGGVPEVMRFMGSLRPRRLLGNMKPLVNGQMRGRTVAVEECTFIGEQEVVALKTTTGTFVAEGFASHNCDRPDSEATRFFESSGVDPWTRNRLSLLNATALRLSSGNSNLRLAVAADRLYVTDGNAVLFTTDGVNFSALGGNPAVPALSIASDGATVYIAYGASGVYSVAPGAGGMTSYVTGTALAVGYAKGRLIVLEGATASPRIYNVTTSGGAITAGVLLLTVPNLVVSPGQWVAEGPNALYIVGAVGDKSRIWRTAVQPDGTALAVPTLTGSLPDGQLARSAVGYLNSVVLVGTDDRVFVMAISDGDGNLTPVGNVKTALPVYGFEPQDRFVWYGGHASATLGRLDLSRDATEEGDFTPAYAADLAAALSGEVQSVATFNGKRVFTVSGRGLYVETDAKVASGTIDMGIIGFGIGDPKNALYADVRHLPLVSGDTVLVEAAEDGGPWAFVGSSALPGAVSSTASLGQLLAEAIRLRITLTGSAVLTMLTARAAPAPKTGEIIRLRLLLFRHGTDLGGQTYTVEVPVEREYLRGLRSAKTAVTVQIGGESFTAIVDRLVRFTPDLMAADDGGAWLGYWSGVQDLDLKRVDA